MIAYLFEGDYQFEKNNEKQNGGQCDGVKGKKQKRKDADDARWYILRHNVMFLGLSTVTVHTTYSNTYSTKGSRIKGLAMNNVHYFSLTHERTTGYSRKQEGDSGIALRLYLL